MTKSWTSANVKGVVLEAKLVYLLVWRRKKKDTMIMSATAWRVSMVTGRWVAMTAICLMDGDGLDPVGWMVLLFPTGKHTTDAEVRLACGV